MVKRKQRIVSLSQIQNLTPHPVSAYTWDGNIVHFPPLSPEDITRTDDVYFIVEKVPQKHEALPYHFLTATTPSLGRGEELVSALYLGETRVYPM